MATRYCKFNVNLRVILIFSNDKSVNAQRVTTSLLVDNRFFWTYVISEHWGDFVSLSLEGRRVYSSAALHREGVTELGQYPRNSSLWQRDWISQWRISSETTAVQSEANSYNLVYYIYVLGNFVWWKFKNHLLFPLKNQKAIW